MKRTEKLKTLDDELNKTARQMKVLMISVPLNYIHIFDANELRMLKFVFHIEPSTFRMAVRLSTRPPETIRIAPNQTMQ